MTEWVGVGVGTLTDGVGIVTAWAGNAVSVGERGNFKKIPTITQDLSM